MKILDSFMHGAEYLRTGVPPAGSPSAGTRTLAAAGTRKA
jgi:hypothetical protein